MDGSKGGGWKRLFLFSGVVALAAIIMMGCTVLGDNDTLPEEVRYEEQK